MRARAGAGGAVTALALAATAMAQEPAPAPVPEPAPPAPPVGNFGGGAVLAPPSDPLGPGNAILGIRAAPGGALQIEATVRGRCGGGTFPARTTVAADGSFVAKGTNRRRPEPGIRLKTTYEIAGTLTATGVENGSAKAASEIRVRGQRTIRCKSGTVAFKARRPSADIGTPGAAPSARYYGLTSEKRSGPRRGIVMRISSDGRSLSRALYGVTLTCDKRSLPDIVDTPRRSLPIDAKGHVEDRVRSTVRERRTVTRSVERFSGTLGSTGATGSFSITERTTSRKTGKLVERCRTGTVKWTAAP